MHPGFSWGWASHDTAFCVLQCFDDSGSQHPLSVGDAHTGDQHASGWTIPPSSDWGSYHVGHTGMHEPQRWGGKGARWLHCGCQLQGAPRISGSQAVMKQALNWSSWGRTWSRAQRRSPGREGLPESLDSGGCGQGLSPEPQLGVGGWTLRPGARGVPWYV